MAGQSACVQLLDCDGKLQDDNLQTAMGAMSCSYCVISVFGAQGSGKSTLLNNLFGTTFAAPVKRQGRVTEGVWVQSTQQDDLNVIVLDVEGTGGKERAANPDMDRQLGLLALNAADVVMLNINNVLVESEETMMLFRVIFQEKLKLEAQPTNGTQHRRMTLFIVVRDIAPQDQQDDYARANTFKQNLDEAWQHIVKPPHLQASRIEDCFQVEVAGLPDKRYAEDDFVMEAKQVTARVLQAGRTMLTPLRLQMPSHLYACYVKELWSQITSAHGLRLQSMLASLGDVACTQAAADAFAKFERQSKWLSIKRVCQEHLLPINDLRNLVKQATDQTMEGYEASTEWYDQSAASKQKDVLRSRIFGQVYAAVTAPQTEHLARFRLAYFVEHILPLDPDSPSRSSHSAHTAFGGAATLESYKTGDVNYIDISDNTMIKAEISCTCEQYGADLVAMHKLAGKALQPAELQKSIGQLHDHLVEVLAKLRKAQAAKAQEAALRAQARAHAERAAAEAARARAEAERARAAKSERAQAEARVKAAEEAQARAAAAQARACEDERPSLASRLFMGAIQTVLPVLLDVGLDMAAGPSSSLSSRQLYLGPNGGTYYLTPGGNKRYV